ncbi:MAG: GNAT family N-acetyltransferase [bacterium]
MNLKSLYHKPEYKEINKGLNIKDNDQELTFRNEIKADDPVKILEIIESTSVFSPEEVNIALELADERLKRGDQSGYHFLFGERYGKMVGYTCFGRIAGTISSFDLYWVAVHRDLHNLGIGKALLTKSESIISEMGGDRIYIETSSRKSYESARLFYSHCGYKKEAILKDFYSTGDNKVIYVKEIKRR